VGATHRHTHAERMNDDGMGAQGEGGRRQGKRTRKSRPPAKFNKNPHTMRYEEDIDGAPLLPDDGYNWKQYGKKVIKGRPHRRWYFKCTHKGCHIRKFAHPVKSERKVTIAYDGEHNHDPPEVRDRKKQRLQLERKDAQKQMHQQQQLQSQGLGRREEPKKQTIGEFRDELRKKPDLRWRQSQQLHK